MNLTFKNETFRDDYTFRNSPEADPALSLPVPRRQVHVFGEHGAACSVQGPRATPTTT